MPDFLQTIITWATTAGVKIIIALVIMFIAFKVINFAAKKIQKRIEAKGKIDKTLAKTFTYIGKIALKILVVIDLELKIGYTGGYSLESGL